MVLTVCNITVTLRGFCYKRRKQAGFPGKKAQKKRARPAGRHPLTGDAASLYIRKMGKCAALPHWKRRISRLRQPRGIPYRWNPHSCSRRGGVPKDGLCPSECPPHFLFLLAKKKTCRTRYKRKSVRDELTRKGPTHPKRGAGRHALPIKSKSFLPAAPIGVPCGNALPHLGARNSPGCKEDALCSMFRCRWRSFAEWAALSNAGSARYRLPCRPQPPPAGCADRRSLRNRAPAFGSAAFTGLQRGRPLLLIPLPLALIRGTGSAEQREERGKRN